VAGRVPARPPMTVTDKRSDARADFPAPCRRLRAPAGHHRATPRCAGPIFSTTPPLVARTSASSRVLGAVAEIDADDGDLVAHRFFHQLGGGQKIEIEVLFDDADVARREQRGFRPNLRRDILESMRCRPPLTSMSRRSCTSASRRRRSSRQVLSAAMAGAPASKHDTHPIERRCTRMASSDD